MRNLVAIIVCAVVGVGCVASSVHAKTTTQLSLEVVDTMQGDHYRVDKIYDHNNGAVCYVTQSDWMAISGDNTAISCFKNN